MALIKIKSSVCNYELPQWIYIVVERFKSSECDFVEGQKTIKGIRTLAEIEMMIHIMIPPDIYR